MSSTPTHSLACGLLPLTSIIIPPRLREDTADIRIKIESDLAPSIQNHGLIHPITLAEHELIEGKNHLGDTISSQFSLIAGWSRLTAFSLLGYPEIPYNIRTSIPEHERLALELEENIRRNEMPWRDIILAIRLTHRAKRAAASVDHVKWGQSQTGFLIGQSAGYVSEAIMFADLIIAGDKEIASASSHWDARRILTQRKEDEAKAKLALIHTRNVGAARSIIKQKEVPSSSSSPDLSDLLAPTPSSIETLSASNSESVTTVELSKMLFNMDTVYPQSDGSPSWFDQAEPESVDLVYTDHPFGIDMDDLDLVQQDRIEEAHGVEENLEQMPLFLKGSFKVLKKDGYLLFWCDLCHWEKLISWAEEAGFQVQPYPIVWIKTHSCKNKAAQAWWTKAVEYVMVCRKGKPTLSIPQKVNYYACSGYAERKSQNNPFSKPFEFSKWLLEPLIIPGMTVLDCYAGAGSLVRACIRLGCKVVAVEKEVHHFNDMLESVKETFEETVQGKIDFV